MNITLAEAGALRIGVVSPGEVSIHTVQDAMDLMATVWHVHQCEGIVLPKECMCEEFFDLKTGLAGEILQKYTNYGMRIALIGDFSVYESKSLRDFIRESNKGGRVLFLPTAEEALEKFAAAK